MESPFSYIMLNIFVLVRYFCIVRYFGIRCLVFWKLMSGFFSIAEKFSVEKLYCHSFAVRKISNSNSSSSSVANNLKFGERMLCKILFRKIYISLHGSTSIAGAYLQLLEHICNGLSISHLTRYHTHQDVWLSTVVHFTDAVLYCETFYSM